MVEIALDFRITVWCNAFSFRSLRPWRGKKRRKGKGKVAREKGRLVRAREKAAKRRGVRVRERGARRREKLVRRMKV